jgi:hypothetical protein
MFDECTRAQRELLLALSQISASAKLLDNHILANREKSGNNSLSEEAQRMKK